MNKPIQPPEAMRKPLIQLWHAAADFGRSEILPCLLQWDRDARFPRELWRRLGEAELLALPLPETFGGGGATARHLAVALDGLAYGSKDLGVVNSWGVHTAMAGMAIARFGTAEQQKRYLPRLASGETVAAFALTEPAAGSDISALATTAQPVEDGYVLSGEKAFVTNAPDAGLIVVVAIVVREGKRMPTAFLVEPISGMDVGPPREKSCIRTSPMADLRLDGCRVPASQRLGAEGAALETVVRTALAWDRTVVWAGRLGRLRAILEDSVSYAQQRMQSGKPIARHQAIAFKLADMKVSLDAAELLLSRALSELDADGPDWLQASVARLFLGEAVMSAASEAARIFGGNGVYPEHHVERYCRDATLDGIGGGTSEIQRLIISRRLLDGGAAPGWMSQWALPGEVVR